MAAGSRDYRNANLRKQEFSTDDLIGADFTNATIQESSFKSCDLTGLKFNGTRFVDCKFDSAFGTLVQFRGAKFLECNLTQASFRNSVFAHSSISQCDLIEASFDECDFSRSRLEKNVISRTSITRSNLEFSSLLFIPADPVPTLNLSGSLLWQLQTRSADEVQLFGLPYGWSQVGWHLMGPGTVFNGADLHDNEYSFQLYDMSITGVEFRNFNFSGSQLMNIEFVDCLFVDCVYGGEFDGSDFSASSFISTVGPRVFDFSGSTLDLVSLPYWLINSPGYLTGSGIKGSPRSSGHYQLVAGKFEYKRSYPMQ